MEYNKLSPIGAIRDDLRIAFLGVQLARVLGAKDVKVEQFLLTFDDPEAEEVVGAKESELLDKATFIQKLFEAQGLPPMIGLVP